MVDIHTIGAGGGSIARVDAGGVMYVGPESAGAVPGPACYAQGGHEVTVTDANLILGHMPRSTLLGGSMPLDYEAARLALQNLQQTSGLATIEETASGVIQIANENMADALRVISIERGIDPADFSLLAFGGAGGLHVCALAEILNMHKAIAPAYSGVLSALGMLLAVPGRQYSQTVSRLLQETDITEIEHGFSVLREQGRHALAREGISADDIAYDCKLDICYHGQSSSLAIDWHHHEQVAQDFHALHEQRYGHRLDSPLELTTLRVSANALQTEFDFPEYSADEQPTSAITETEIYGIEKPVAVRPRASLQLNEVVEGPLIITDEVATLYVQANWQAQLDAFGNIRLQR